MTTEDLEYYINSVAKSETGLEMINTQLWKKLYGG